MIVGNCRREIVPHKRPGPDCGNMSRVDSPTLIPRQEQGCTPGAEHSTIQNLGDYQGDILVACGYGAVVHVITEVRCEPHEIRRTCG